MAARILKIRILRPLAVVVLAAIGFVLLVPQTVVHTAAIGVIMVKTPHISSIKFKAPESEPLTGTDLPMKTMKAALKQEPSETGGFVSIWSGPTKTETSATAVVAILPSVGEARSTFAEAKADYSRPSAKLKKSEHLTTEALFSVADVSDSSGARFAVAKTSSTAASTLEAVIFQVGRAVAVVYLDTTSGSITRSEISALASAEDAKLLGVSSFSTSRTHVPLVASIVYWGVSIVVAVGVYFGPELLQRRRQGHAVRRAAAVRYEYRARGSKVVKRRRVPDWTQRR